MVDMAALGQVFSEYFGFLCQSSFHQLLHNHHHLLSGAGIYNRPVVAAVRKVPPHKLKKKRKKRINRTSLTPIENNM
jgi:hypothetical protein